MYIDSDADSHFALLGDNTYTSTGTCNGTGKGYMFLLEDEKDDGDDDIK
jgi:hypothetical protein